jgi:hypothetical protein
MNSVREAKQKCFVREDSPQNVNMLTHITGVENCLNQGMIRTENEAVQQKFVKRKFPVTERR